MRRSSQRRSASATRCCRSRDAVNGFEEILSGTFAGLPRDITEENLQARARGTLLMAISNKTGAMVVTTGNKSEMSVGYATLYGDMNGGFNPIKDIYKTEVFRLSSLAQFAGSPTARSVRRARSSRPTSSRGRRPRSCAKTRPTRIRCRPTTCSTRSWSGWSSARSRWPRSSPPGFDREVVARIDRLLNIAEYKRRQAAPGVKVTAEEFRPRPPLSHHQPISRYRQAAARTGREAGVARGSRGVGGSVRRIVGLLLAAG